MDDKKSSSGSESGHDTEKRPSSRKGSDASPKSAQSSRTGESNKLLKPAKVKSPNKKSKSTFVLDENDGKNVFLI